MSSIDLHPFSITSEPEFVKLQDMAQNVGLKKLLVPSENNVCSKPCALATNMAWNLYFAVLICSQPNKISVSCFVGK